jgi:hypothetical protein
MGSIAKLTAELRSRIGLREATSLSELTVLARQQLAEAKGQLKDAEPSKDVPADCLKAANAFRDSLKGGDKLEEAASELLKVAKPLSDAKAMQSLDLKRSAMDAESATVKLKQAVDAIYGPYAEGRKAFYGVALAWDMYDPPASTSSKKPSKSVKNVEITSLAGEMAFAAANLQTNVRDFLEKAATASKVFRAAAKKTGLEGGELSDSDKKAIIDAGFAVRASADPLFGRSQGIARRAVEVIDQLRAQEKYEAKSSKKLAIVLDVEDDAELGGMELL